MSYPIDDTRVQRFWNDQAEWSQATFGADSVRGPIGPLKHLAKEAQEAIDTGGADPTEIADCLFLVFDAARRSGLTLAGLMNACEIKLAANKLRRWGPQTIDGPVEHIRDSEEEPA